MDLRSEPLRQEPVVELGTGTGEAIAKVLKETRFAGEIHGYEIQAETCEYASEVIRRYGVAGYQVLNHDFFTAVPDHLRRRAISNPPYLPAPDPEINMPELWGGPDGSDVIARLLGSGFGSSSRRCRAFPIHSAPSTAPPGMATKWPISR